MTLSPKLINNKINSVRIIKPLVVKSPLESFISEIKDSKVLGIQRHGKSLFFILNREKASTYLKVHLGMTGQLLFKSKTEKIDPYTRVVFNLGKGRVDLHYRDVRQFGKIQISKQPFEPSWGPDAWLSSEELILNNLLKRKGMIKHALLDQKVMAGVGNIYADESLFLSKIHPEQKVEKIDQSKLVILISKIKYVFERSIKMGGTTFRDYLNSDGEKGKFLKMLNVYGREGEYCKVCRSSIRKIVVASRGTHFCPTCQPGKVKIK